MSDTLIYTVQNHVGILRVNRPEARNALNWEAQAAFARVVQTAAEDEALRALIVVGTGQQAFVSGGDLGELAGRPDREAGARLNRVMGQALAQLTHLPFPVIGAANGDAAGGGTEILSACDLRLAAAHARFHFVHVKMGLTTGWGGTGRFVRLLGQSRAADLLLNGRSLTAVEAQAIGFIHRVAPLEQAVLTAALAWADELRQLPRHALAALKSLLWEAAHEPLEAYYQQEREQFLALYGQADNREAVSAFVEKRRPNFNAAG